MNTHDQDSAMGVMRKIAMRVLDVATNLCRGPNENTDVFYMPVIVLFAIKEDFLISTSVHFDANQPSDEVARLLRITADNIDMKSSEGKTLQ